MTLSANILRFLFLLSLLVASRALFIDQMLVGEEGSFAALIVQTPYSSAVTPDGMPQMNIGEIRGQTLYAPFQRNIMPYILLERVGGALVQTVLPTAPFDPQKLTIAVRSIYFAFFLVGAGGLLWLAARSWIGTIIALFTLSVPLVVGASIQPQIDGSTGVLLVGIAGVLLMGDWRAKIPAFWLAGLAIGLGRHELALAFGAAAVTTWALRAIFGFHSVAKVAPFAAGLAIGALTSYAISPADYLAGFGTMQRVYELPTSPLATLTAQFPQVWPVWALMTGANLLVLWNLRDLLDRRPQAVMLVIGASAVVLGFALSGWPGDGLPRYYVPAAIAFATALAGLQEKFAALPRTLVAVSVVAMVAATWGNSKTLYHSWMNGSSITSLPGLSLAGLRADFAASAERARAKDPIVLQQASFWIYHPGVDFISADMGSEGARIYLQQTFPREAERLASD